jgi:hypothetical protein
MCVKEGSSSPPAGEHDKVYKLRKAVLHPNAKLNSLLKSRRRLSEEERTPDPPK